MTSAAIDTMGADISELYEMVANLRIELENATYEIHELHERVRDLEESDE